MTAEHKKAELIQGDTWKIIGPQKDDAGAALDLTGATVEWALIDRHNNTVAAAATGSGITITAPTDGLLEIVVPPQVTKGIQPGEYRDQLRIMIGGFVATTWRGPIIVGFAPSYQV